MTFVEAAIEILKREGKPMSSRRLAELAVKLNLLSVVGRDPESTMQQRLDDAMARAVRHPDLVRLKPDTFGLHSYPAQPYPGNGHGARAAAAPEGGAAAAGGEAAGEAGGEPKKGRRRRRRGGRRSGEGAAAEGQGAEGQPAEAGDAAGEGDDEAAEPAVAATPGAEGDAAPAGEGATAAGAAAGGAAGEKRRRRRRGGRGRHRREGGPAEAAPAGAGVEDEADDDEVEEASADQDAAAQAGAKAPPPIPEELPSEAAAAGTTDEEMAAASEGGGEAAEAPEPAGDEAVEAVDAAEAADAAVEAAGADDAGADDAELLDDSEPAEGEELDADIDHDTGPLMAPAFGAEDVTRTDDDRTVRPEIRGSRDERHRRDRHKGGRDRDRHKDRKGGGEHRAGEHKAQEHKAHEHKPHEHKPQEHKAQEHKAHEHKPQHEPRPDRPAEGRAAGGGLLETLIDVLRASEGRPMHVRHLVETAQKQRKLVDDKTQPADLVRLARAALVRELRERDAEGLRPRVKALGGGHYGTVDRKLDPDLLQAERDLGERAARLREATRTAVRRRMGRMSPAAFDALGRTLCDKLGITGLELLRRGEGVTYWGGVSTRGVGAVRTLVALRPGEVEINRRAVGELRAGLAAKGYDEGLLFAVGRPNPEALAELKAGGVRLYDGAALAGLLIKHGLGVRRAALPIDYLDPDFFSELSEG